MALHKPDESHPQSRLQRWLSPPVFPDVAKTYMAALINITLLTVIGIWLATILLQIGLHAVISWGNVAIALVSCLALEILREWMGRGNTRWVSILIPTVAVIATLFQIINLGTITTVHISGFLLAILLATMLTGKKAGWIISMITILIVASLANLETNGILKPDLPLDPANQAVIFTLIVIITYTTLISVESAVSWAINNSHKELNQRKKAEEALHQLNISLDQRVSERTRELEASICRHQQTEQALRARNESFSALHSSTLAFLRYRNIDELLQSLVDYATALLDVPFAEIVTLEDDELVVRAFSANQPYLAGDRARRGQALLTWQAVDTLEPAVLADYSIWPHRRAIFEPNLQHAVAELPILVGDGQRCLGVLGLGRTQPNMPFTPEEIEIGKLFTQIAGLAIENIQLQGNLIEQSLRDPLTGLYNRRFLFETLQRNFTCAGNDQPTVSFVLLDIDHFKKINDQYGHGAGDAMLCALADKLRELVRAGDILCRYGGDEHIIVLNQTPGKTALAHTEYLRQAVEAMTVTYQEDTLRFTVSIGVATYPDHGGDIDEVISKADRALYHSKNTGRNRCSLYEEV